MRLSYLTVLAVAALVACVNASSAAALEKTVNANNQLDRAFSNGPSAIGKRLLRVEKDVQDDDDEERTAITKFGNVIKSKNLAKIVPEVITKQQTKLQGLVAFQKSTDDAFTALKLAGLSTKQLYKVDALPTYVKFSEQLGTKDMYGIRTLLSHFSEKTLVSTVNSGLQSNNKLTFDTADRLRAGLIGKWWREGKSTNEVTQLLKDGAKVLSDTNKYALRKYILAFNKRHISNIAA